MSLDDSPENRKNRLSFAANSSLGLIVKRAIEAVQIDV